MAYIHKRVGKNGDISYRAQVRIKGHPTQSATFTQKTKAQNWAAKMEVAIKDGQTLAVVESRKRTLNDVIDRYLRDVVSAKTETRKELLNHLEVWRELLGDYALIAIKPALIMDAWETIATRKTPKGGHKSPATLNRYMASLSVVFSHAYKKLEWIDTNPIEKITKKQEPEGRVRYLDDNERERLLTACRESENLLLYPIVLMGITTGARRSEILNLRWSDINLNIKEGMGRAIVQKTKNKEKRTLAIIEPMLSILRDMAANKGDSEFVFYAQRDTGESHPANVTWAWYAALEKANIKDFRFHDLRHTAASYLAMGGASMGELMDIMGHKSPSMSKRYMHLSDEHKQSVVERAMGKKFTGGTQ